MKIRNTLAASAAILAVAVAGWVWSGPGIAIAGQTPATPAGDGTIVYQRPEIVRPSANSESPVEASVNGVDVITLTDLTFHPLVPCRIVDTRAINARLPNQGVYSFDAFTDTTYVGQGGFDGDCGIPFTALAVAMNLTAVAPADTGYLTLYPFSSTRPDASTLNFIAGVNIANSATSGRCEVGGGFLCLHDFTVYAHKSAHILVDVVGYYEPPNSVQFDDAGTVVGASLSVIDAANFGPGANGVLFDREVSFCSYSATIGSSIDGPGGPGFIEVNLFMDTDSLIVSTYDFNGDPADYSFQLVVHC